MSAVVENDALFLKQQSLEIGLMNDHASGRDPTPGVDDAMPRNISLVFWCRVHRPSDHSWTVTAVEQQRDLPVGHYPAAWNAQNYSIDLLEHSIER